MWHVNDAVGTVLVGYCSILVNSKESKLSLVSNMYGIDVCLPFSGVMFGHGNGFLYIPFAESLAFACNKQTFAKTLLGRSYYKAQCLCI